MPARVRPEVAARSRTHAAHAHTYTCTQAHVHTPTQTVLCAEEPSQWQQSRRDTRRPASSACMSSPATVDRPTREQLSESSGARLDLIERSTRWPISRLTMENRRHKFGCKITVHRRLSELAMARLISISRPELAHTLYPLFNFIQVTQRWSRTGLSSSVAYGRGMEVIPPETFRLL